MATFSITETVETLQCADCVMTFGVPSRFIKDRQKDHKKFYCPKGHENFYNEESAEEKLRRERDHLKQQIARVEDEKREAVAMAELEGKRLVAVAKAETRKLKKRAAAGTCPCCSRSFTNMSEHMKKQHPKFVAGEINNIVSMKAVK